VRVMVMEDMPKPRDTFMLLRGSYEKPMAKVTAAVPAALVAPVAHAPGSPNHRLALARWLLSPENPLTARVTVNRIWQQFFGIGLVKTLRDFGIQGGQPCHPGSLDWLATEFVSSRCRVREVRRVLGTSGTDGQASNAGAARFE